MVGTYPDMNYIFFRGIPKMIQVADDVHRLTDYIMDLRNMTIGLVCFSFIGVIFLFLRHIQKRNSTDMREKMILADHSDNLGKLMQSHNGTYRSYSDPWHSSETKTSTVILEKELSGKTTSTATKMKAKEFAKNTKFANDENRTNESPFKGLKC
ncbi:Calreticulin [Dirofilaria immitis]